MKNEEAIPEYFIIAERRSKWQKPTLKVTRGVLYKYAMCVKDASEGCVTDEAP